MSDIRDAEGMAACLRHWTAEHCGSAARAERVERLPGHSGLLYRFEVAAPGREPERLVIRVPPPGVRRRNNQDVLRQVPVLQLLERHRIPAPRARWWSEDERWFSVPYLVMSHLPGRPMGDVFDRGAGPVPDAETARAMFAQAVRALVAMHRIDAEKELADWEDPRPIPAEIDHWLPILEKSSDPGWIARGRRASEALRASAPADPAVGLVHGDYYSNNWLFEAGRLTGIVDWESVSLGPRLLDLGWLCMMYDPACWGPKRCAHLDWCPAPEELIESYSEAAGGLPPHLDWYRALAGYRLACLTGYYFELHRKGRRHDPAWEVLAESFPLLLGRALSLDA